MPNKSGVVAAMKSTRPITVDSMRKREACSAESTSLPSCTCRVLANATSRLVLQRATNLALKY